MFSVQFIISNLPNVSKDHFLTSANPPLFYLLFIKRPVCYPLYLLYFIPTSAIQPLKLNQSTSLHIFCSRLLYWRLALIFAALHRKRISLRWGLDDVLFQASLLVIFYFFRPVFKHLFVICKCSYRKKKVRK